MTANPAARALARAQEITAELAARAAAGTYVPQPAPDVVRVRPANDNAIPYCPHTPTAKQRELHSLDHVREVFFGGAARGGKTDGALQAALRYVHVPGYAALILRRDYTQLLLADGILARANEWLLGKPGVRWSEKEHSFIFQCPGGGTSRIAFGYLDSERDKTRYQGARYQLVIFDELTHFELRHYRWMFSRQSRPPTGPLSQVPLRMRATGNPGGIGHFWVWQRFINPETRHPGAVFLPAKLTDNPYEDEAAYRESISNLSPVEQAQLLDGIWDALQEGDVFKTDRIVLLDTIPAGLIAFARYWDCAATPAPSRSGEPQPGKGDYTASCLIGIAADRSVVLLDVTEDQWDVGELPQRMQLQADTDGRGTAVRIEEEGGHSGKLSIRVYQDALRGYSCEGIRSTGSKLERCKPLSAAVFNRQVSAVRGPRLKLLLDRMHAYPYVAHDDVIDAASGAYNFLMGEHVGDTHIDRVHTGMRTADLRKLMGADTRSLSRGVRMG